MLYASDGEGYEFGRNLRVVESDAEFTMYSRIVLKKQQLQEQLNGIKKNHKRLNKHLKATVLGIERRLEDLDRLLTELY